MKNFSIEFINSVNGIDPESLTEDEIEAQSNGLLKMRMKQKTGHNHKGDGDGKTDQG